MSMVQLKTPKWRPIPPAASVMVFNQSNIDERPGGAYLLQKKVYLG
jgi:hypothetical protein